VRGPASQQDLAARLHLEKSTVSRMAAGLEQRGLVVRERDPGNRRLYRLRLTERGAELRAALEATGQWPLNDYFSQPTLDQLTRPAHGSAPETTRELIRYVAPDDDLNYSVLGMLVLERHGTDFTRSQIRDSWVHHLPIGTTFGPERTQLLNAGMHSLLAATGDFTGMTAHADEERMSEWVTVLNPRDELARRLVRSLNTSDPGFCSSNTGFALRYSW
jgi:DNA-binding MarR family transcriptional regulator